MCEPCRAVGQTFAIKINENTNAIAAVNNKLQQVETKIDTKFDDVDSKIGELLRRIETLESAPPPPPPGAGGVSAVDVLHELEQARVRECNIIIHGAPGAPPHVNTAVARKRYDVLLLHDIAITIGIPLMDEEIKFMWRTGKRGEDNTNKPLIVGFRRMEKKEEIMTAAKYLAGSKYEHVSIGHDLTAAQRELKARLRTEAADRNQANSLLPPGERRDVTFKVVGKIGYRQVRPIPNLFGTAAAAVGAAAGDRRRAPPHALQLAHPPSVSATLAPSITGAAQSLLATQLGTQARSFYQLRSFESRRRWLHIPWANRQHGNNKCNSTRCWENNSSNYYNNYSQHGSPLGHSALQDPVRCRRPLSP